MDGTPRHGAEGLVDHAAPERSSGTQVVARPWWSEVDVLGGVAWFVGAMMVASLATMLAPLVVGDEVTDNAPVYAVFFGTLAFQLLLATYPWLVSRRKGLGVAADWRFLPFRTGDIGSGLLLAIGCFVGAQLATVVAAALVGLENPEDASNSDVLTDSRGSLWIIGMIVLIVVGAPLAEELLFRGLVLRVLEQSFGRVFAIVVSSLLFALPHWQATASWQETVVLLSAICVVGLVLATGAMATGRLGPPIIGHLLFNGAGTVIALLV